MKLKTLIAMLALGLVAACDYTPSSYRKPNMIPLSPKLQKLFANTKPVCFGRFIIDVPVDTEIGWGPSKVSAEIVTYPGEAVRVPAEIKAKIAEYKGQQHKSEPFMLLVEQDGPNKESKIVAGYSDNLYDTLVDVDAYLRLPPHAFVMTVKDIPRKRMNEAVAKFTDVSSRLRVRADAEIPTDPGICIESGFVAEAEGKYYELISIGFRILPDVHLSILAIKKDRAVESDSLESLEQNLAKGKTDAEQRGFGEEYAKIKWLRKGRRELLGQIGFEYATRQPASKGNAHEFQFATPGEPKNPFKPVFEIELDTGADGDQPGQAKSSLSDDEAVALWDKILSTLRVRPTTPGKTSDAGGPDSPNPATPKRLPLGTKVSSLRSCPETGVYECPSSAPGVLQRRVYLERSRPMPGAFVIAPKRGIGGFFGGRESKEVETTWTLVAYEQKA